jgi:hypothetical protein
VHNLSTTFVLGYHGCDRETGERLLLNEAFQPSENAYDWLGSGIYFWEANPDRALQWAHERADRILKNEGRKLEPFVVGVAIDLGFCLDLISSNGIHAVEETYISFQSVVAASGAQMPENVSGDDLRLRKLDCAVINFLHAARERTGEEPFDTVRGVFTEGKRIYTNSGFRRKTHIQICVRNDANIHGVFRVHERYFSKANPPAPGDG